MTICTCSLCLCFVAVVTDTRCDVTALLTNHGYVQHKLKATLYDTQHHWLPHSSNDRTSPRNRCHFSTNEMSPSLITWFPSRLFHWLALLWNLTVVHVLCDSAVENINSTNMNEFQQLISNLYSLSVLHGKLQAHNRMVNTASKLQSSSE